MSPNRDDSGIYVGLMSGTSLDAIDAVLVNFKGNNCYLLHSSSTEISNALRSKILQLCSPGANEIEQMGSLDIELGELFAVAVNQLLKQASHSSDEIQAIGSHGQTLRHRPDISRPFTLQIGDAATIAERTGITTVSDFRSRDIAAGGQGAPLVPAFHAQVFDSTEERRAIVNIGGISNITRLAGSSQQPVIGFDSGPGNLLMNGWCKKHLDQEFDNSGEWARSGKVNTHLLKHLLNEPYFSTPPPKSTGRELFNMEWLEKHLSQLPPIPAQDVQATLCELTASTISDAIKQHACECNVLYVCGGGVHNTLLMERLQAQLAPHTVSSSQKIGLHPDWVEACAFAWLAKQAIKKLPGNLPEVTGAKQPVILGAIYQA